MNAAAASPSTWASSRTWAGLVLAPNAALALEPGPWTAAGAGSRRLLRDKATRGRPAATQLDGPRRAE